jgi:hypothetical protein
MLTYAGYTFFLQVLCEAEGEQFQLPHFAPRALRHLVQLDALESLAPVCQ